MTELDQAALAFGAHVLDRGRVGIEGGERLDRRLQLLRRRLGFGDDSPARAIVDPADANTLDRADGGDGLVQLAAVEAHIITS